jgi:hypothetical protein
MSKVTTAAVSDKLVPLKADGNMGSFLLQIVAKAHVEHPPFHRWKLGARDGTVVHR